MREFLTLEYLDEARFAAVQFEEFVISILQVAIVTLILTIVAMVAADAWVKEDTARVERLSRHIYEVALHRERATLEPTTTPAQPQPGDVAQPKTRVFQDASRERGK